MDTMLQIVRQEDVEKRFNRKHIDGYIRQALAEIPENQAKITEGVERLREWMADDSHYDGKKARLAQLSLLDLDKTVEEIMVGIAYYVKPVLFTSATAQLAGRLGLDDKKDSIQTMGEVLAVLCLTDAFDITKEHKLASLMLESKLYLSEEVLNFIEQSEYLPPMVCEPLELESNYDSGYLTHKESLILGKGNHHDGNICLDVLNLANSVKLKLDTDFLRTVEEECGTELTLEGVKNKALKKGVVYSDDQAAAVLVKLQEQWPAFKATSAKMYMLMHNLGNEFHLTHKVDKRGRIYAQGYHISTQGSSYKKAMIELANEEIVEGVPA